MEQLKKVVRLNENLMGNEMEVKVDDGGGGEAHANELSDMDKLPTEILMKILDYLDEQQLVKFRILNSRLNEICCLLLQDKTKLKRDSKLNVQINQCQGQNYLDCKTVIKKSLDDFIGCFSPLEAEKSSDRSCSPSPFSRFNIKSLRHFNEAQMTQFVSVFGPYIKSLTFIDIEKQDCENFERLWTLLLQFAPNIQHLGIGGDRHLNNLKLVGSNKNTDTNSESQKQSDSFLKNLKYIQVTKKHGFGEFNSFLQELLENAPNIQEVVACHLNCFKCPKLLDLQIWQQSNKIHLFKKLGIRNYNISPDLLSPPALMKNLQLEYLSAHCYISSSNPMEYETLALSYIYHAFKSSQNTLSSLNLSNLKLKSMDFCFKDISSLPNVRQVSIHNCMSGESTRILEKFSQLCPNVKHLSFSQICGSFSEVVQIFWTRFEGLKSLKFSIVVNNEDRRPLILDSGLSGYSKESVERIQAKLEDGISLEEARRSESQKQSILDLKELSRLELEFFMCRRTSVMEKAENQLRNSIFIQILPQQIRENPTSIVFRYMEEY